ncbi:MAG TPA: hypothetical protein VK171_05370 [Fimbriimonas sp.]|nr:hypothetical protein [Fimbriimonas sp.]
MTPAFLLITTQIPAVYTSVEYHNDRFDFSVSIPSFLVRAEPPVNGDGQRFHTKDGKFSISVSGILNVLDRALEQELDERLRDAKGKLLGVKSGKDWFSFAHRNADIVTWQKMFLVDLKSGDGSIQAFQGIYAEYDASVETKAAPLVQKVSASFKPGKEYWR